ncbi:UPF0524 protein C3orf70 [Varanus komodoensis]|nr:UPF0524 protein C3orf70 [Varanus komodoensis]
MSGVGAAATAAAASLLAGKSEKLDEAQALARSCAGRPDFQPCDGLSLCTTHSHGRCFRLHWCCHLGWCHSDLGFGETEEDLNEQQSPNLKQDNEQTSLLFPGTPSSSGYGPERPRKSVGAWRFLIHLFISSTGKYVYQPMTPVEQLPSTEIPVRPRGTTNTIQISVSLMEHFLKFAPVFQPPLPPDSPRFCTISDLFIDNYRVKCINGKMCYVQRQPPALAHKVKPQEVPTRNALILRENNTPKIDHCSSPSSSEDSGINAVGAHYMESCDEDTEEGAELSSEEDYSPDSSWEPDECPLLSPSQCELEVIETIETTV